jgi:hypothetical protein
MIRLARQSRLLISVAIMGVAGVMVFGCGHPQHSNAPVSPPSPQVTPPPSPTEGESSTSKTPVKNSLVALLQQDAQSDHVFPSGVQVKSVTLADGVVSIDFSHEFGELANSGETVESDAQHALRKTLSRFTSIEKMRVTVDGKPFESQATDWYTPFPVRDSESDIHNKKAPPIGSDSAAR